MYTTLQSTCFPGTPPPCTKMPTQLGIFHFIVERVYFWTGLWKCPIPLILCFSLPNLLDISCLRYCHSLWPQYFVEFGTLFEHKWSHYVHFWGLTPILLGPFFGMDQSCWVDFWWMANIIGSILRDGPITIAPPNCRPWPTGKHTLFPGIDYKSHPKRWSALDHDWSILTPPCLRFLTHS